MFPIFTGKGIQMQVELLQDLRLVCMASGKSLLVRKGIREMERVPNRFPKDFPEPQSDWLIIPKTNVGAAVGYLRRVVVVRDDSGKVLKI